MSRWEIPDNWEWVKVGEIAKVIGGGTPSTRSVQNFSEDTGIAWLTPADLSGYEDTYIKRGKRNITQVGYDSSSAVLLPPGTVLYTSRAPIGYCVIAENEIATNQGFKSFVLFGQIVPEYIRYYLLSSKEYAELFASGTTFKELSGSRIKELLIPLPPLNEQKRVSQKIKAFQVRTNKVRKSLEAIPALLEKFRQSVLSSAFRGDLTADWRAQNPDIESAEKLLERIRKERRKRWEENELAKMEAKGKTPKDDKWKKKYKEPEPVDTTDLPELPEGWCWAALEELSEKVTDGTHQSPPFVSSGIPFLVISNIIKGIIDWEGVNKWVAEATYEKFTSNCKPEKGDVLYSAVGSYGVAAEVLTKEKFMFQRHIAHIKPVKNVVSSTYIMLSLNSPFSLSQAHKLARGVAQKTVILTLLRRFNLALPPEMEQYEIINRVNKALRLSQNVKSFVGKSIAQAEFLDQSILAKAFRGELVPQDPKDEPASQLLKRIKQEKATMEAGKKRTVKVSRKKGT